jgi:hypothetical protein
MTGTRTIPALAAAALLAAAAACAADGGPFTPRATLSPGDGWLRTDRAEYQVQDVNGILTVDFGLVYENPLDRDVAVPACHSPHPPLLEQLVAGEWRLAYSPPVLMCITAPLVIPRGREHHFRHVVRADAWELERWPTAGAERTGNYRLVWAVGTHDRRATNGMGAPLPLELRLSNEFLLSFP